jgi:tetratricopeptide (TPR) repeat protein
MSRALLAVCALLVVGRAARAQDEKTERARAHLKSAIAYYDDGRYEDAVREMKVAYDLRPLPDLQYNLAQCYERLGRLDDAAQAYEAYLNGRPDAQDRANIEARIANLRERARAGQTAPPPAEKEKVVFKTIVVYREAPPKPGRAARWAGYGLSVLALGALASGIAFAVLAKQDADQVTHGGNPAAPVVFGDQIRSTQDSGKTDVIVSGVSFGVAGLAAAGAVALFLVGKKIDREAPKLTLAPALLGGGGGLVATGRF